MFPLRPKPVPKNANWSRKKEYHPAYLPRAIVIKAESMHDARETATHNCRMPLMSVHIQLFTSSVVDSYQMDDCGL